MPGRPPSRQDAAGGSMPPGAAGAASRPTGPLALFAVCLGFFMVLMDSSALNVALPAVRGDLAGSLAGLEWLINGYTITLAAFLLSGGAVSDRWGARRVFEVSLLGFVVTSAACAASPGLGFLVTARVLQGVTAGGLLPASLAVIARMYPDLALRARALTVWGGVSSLALVFGPVLGGVLTTAVGWRSVFLINVPVGLLAWWLTRLQVPPSATREAALDPAGQTLAVMVVGCGIGALIEGGAQGWTDIVTWALLAVTLASAAVFVAVERRAAAPVLPLGLLARPRFACGLVIGALFQFGAYGAQFALSLRLQSAWGLDALGAGLSFVPFAALWALASFVLARAVTRTGPRPLLIGGALAAAAGACALLPLGGHPGWWIFFCGSALLGLGAGLMGPSLPAVVLSAVPADRSGLASGALNALRQIGGAVAIALFGALLDGSPGPAGLRICLALVALAFLVVVMAVPAALPSRARAPHTTRP
ncbi:MFS transporter [Streptomyces sp. NPDC001832]|uniref:MFS transporter n=1 Tax=Streptomyces sp. NPDC001832 TaxID=3154527 RepID=UPI00331A05C7